MGPDEILAAVSSLDEPWRSRFEEFIANVSTRWAWSGKGRPTKDELRAWLREDLDLRRLVARMLHAWRRPGRTTKRIEMQEGCLPGREGETRVEGASSAAPACPGGDLVPGLSPRAQSQGGEERSR